MVLPDALKVLRLQHGHRFCKLGDLAFSVRLAWGGGRQGPSWQARVGVLHRSCGEQRGTCVAQSAV